jgi:hypothetical protein
MKKFPFHVEIFVLLKKQKKNVALSKVEHFFPFALSIFSNRSVSAESMKFQATILILQAVFGCVSLQKPRMTRES